MPIHNTTILENVTSPIRLVEIKVNKAKHNETPLDKN